ncbi:STAS domain-containing protein [Streptomyces sp. NBC_01217]|uniref:STAS domain-containing protein n=1 Tax=Streptomyces sp. NBC_01217 TaxID=2903779 RepID=UPI002E144C26|nr:STAS domain-containing protein [Streptomyces sp. NBC_01217]
MNARRKKALTTTVWLAWTGAAVWTGVVADPYWLQITCLIAAATALRLALRGVRPATGHVRPGLRFGGGRAVVRLKGDLTATSAENATRRLTEALDPPPSVLEIDLANVSSLGKDSIQALFTALRTAGEQGIPVLVSGANRQTRTTLHGKGLDRFFRYADVPGQPGHEDRR